MWVKPNGFFFSILLHAGRTTVLSARTLTHNRRSMLCANCQWIIHITYKWGDENIAWNAEGHIQGYYTPTCIMYYNRAMFKVRSLSTSPHLSLSLNSLLVIVKRICLVIERIKELAKDWKFDRCVHDMKKKKERLMKSVKTKSMIYHFDLPNNNVERESKLQWWWCWNEPNNKCCSYHDISVKTIEIDIIY